MSEAIIKLKTLHNKQQYILDTAKRFNVLKCGRRFGKTSLAEELVIDPALDGYPTAFYAPTYKDLSDFWFNIKTVLHEVIETKNEQTKQLRLITGGIIDFWSLDEPDSGRGRKYKRVIIDECEKAKKIEEAWKGTIRATLTDFIGDCWFLSTPKFGNTFFKELYAQSLKKEFSHEWQSWTFSTYDNPYMQKEEIDAARKTLDELYFRCEYLAEDVNIDKLAFAYAYDKPYHYVSFKEHDIKLNPKEPVKIAFDFNVNPITCILGQSDDSKIRIFKAFAAENSDTSQLCDMILSYLGGERYSIYVTGDANGYKRDTRSNLNDYQIIQKKLGLSKYQLLAPRVNASLRDSRVLTNAILSHADLAINSDNNACKDLDDDLITVTVDESGKLDKKKHGAHTLDNFRYYLATWHFDFLKRKL